jgi:hypothetical protein
MIPLWLAPVLAAAGSTVVKMLLQLLTEKFLREAIIVALEKLVVLTETDVDNQLLEAAKAAWSVPEAPSAPIPPGH